MQDKIMKFLAYNGKILVICANTTNLVEKARNVHDLSPLATATLGRVLTIASLIGSEMKSDKNKLTIQIRGNGEIGTVIAVGKNNGNVKGVVTNPRIDLPLNEDGKLDVGKAIGNEGFINVIKDIGLKEPYIGISPIISGEIAEDFANYFQTSEQKQTAVALGVLVDKNGVKSSGGYIINPMPDATSEDIFKVEQSIFKAGAISKMLDNNLSLQEIAKRVTGDENVQIIEEKLEPIYECDCSKEHMAQGLCAIGKEELEEIIEVDKKAELVCQFCNKKYEFSEQELNEILNNIVDNQK